MSTTESTLNERGKNYGSFESHAEVSQRLKAMIISHYYNVHGQTSENVLPLHMVEAISMICHKLARIANGNPRYIDSWRDIAGYAQLEIDILSNDPKASDAVVSYTQPEEKTKTNQEGN